MKKVKNWIISLLCLLTLTGCVSEGSALSNPLKTDLLIDKTYEECIDLKCDAETKVYIEASLSDEKFAQLKNNTNYKICVYLYFESELEIEGFNPKDSEANIYITKIDLYNNKDIFLTNNIDNIDSCFNYLEYDLDKVEQSYIFCIYCVADATFKLSISLKQK